MGKIGLYLGVAVVAFSASVAGSMFLTSTPEEEPPVESADAAKDADTTEAEPPETFTEDEVPKEMAVAVRSRIPLTPEELFRIGKLMQQRESDLLDRESVIEKDEIRLRLVLDDINAEQKAIESLQLEAAGAIETLQGILDTVGRKLDEVRLEREQAKADAANWESAKDGMSAIAAENMKQVSLWFKSMEPEKAATNLKEIVNDGRLDLAVQLLTNLSERDAASVLDALDDSKLIAEIVNSMQSYQPPRQAKGGRQ